MGNQLSKQKPKIIDKWTFDQTYEIRKSSLAKLGRKIDDTLANSDTVFTVWLSLVGIVLCSSIVVVSYAAVLSLFWSILFGVLALLSFATVVTTGYGFEEASRWLEPIGRNRRRKKVLKQSSDPLVGTNHGRGVSDYCVQFQEKKAFVKEQKVFVDVVAHIFWFSPTLGWKPYRTRERTVVADKAKPDWHEDVLNQQHAFQTEIHQQVEQLELDNIERKNLEQQKALKAKEDKLQQDLEVEEVLSLLQKSKF